MTEKKEEFANALTHGIGTVLFLTAGTCLFAYALYHGNVMLLWPVGVYVFCLLMTYISSTVYHAVTNPDYKKVLRIFDHISIFLLIGGTFTPIVVYNMGDWNGLPFLAVFWGAMACGIILKIFFTGKYRLISTIVYVGVAWIGAMFSEPLLRNMPRQALVFVITGGIFYTAGTVFYMQKRLTYHHAFWHLFVLAGSISHFFAIFYSLGVS
jgi:hemolysin III